MQLQLDGGSHEEYHNLCVAEIERAMTPSTLSGPCVNLKKAFARKQPDRWSKLIQDLNPFRLHNPPMVESGKRLRNTERLVGKTKHEIANMKLVLSQDVIKRVYQWHTTMPLSCEARGDMIQKIPESLNLHPVLEKAIRTTYIPPSVEEKLNVFREKQKEVLELYLSETSNVTSDKNYLKTSYYDFFLRVQALADSRPISDLNERESTGLVIRSGPKCRFMPYLASLLVAMGSQFSMKQLERLSTIRQECLMHVRELKKSHKNLRSGHGMQIQDYLDLTQDIGIDNLRAIDEIPHEKLCLGIKKRNTGCRRRYHLIRALLEEEGMQSELEDLHRELSGNYTGLRYIDILSLQSAWLKEMLDSTIDSICEGSIGDVSRPEKHRKRWGDGLSVILRFLDKHVRQKFEEHLSEYFHPLEWFFKNASIDDYVIAIQVYSKTRKRTVKTISKRKRHCASSEVGNWIRFLKAAHPNYIECDDITSMKAQDILEDIPDIQKNYDENKRRVYNEEEIQQLKDAAIGTREQLLIRICEQVALRSSEVGYLRWKDLIENGYPRLRTCVIQKNNTIRRFKIYEELQRFIKLYYDEYRSEIGDVVDMSDFYVFNIRNPTRPCDTIYYAISKIFKVSGIKDVHVYVHGFRHTYVSRLLHAGNDILKVSRMLGHRNSSITEESYVVDTLDEMEKKVNNPFSDTYVKPLLQSEKKSVESDSFNVLGNVLSMLKRVQSQGCGNGELPSYDCVNLISQLEDFIDNNSDVTSVQTRDTLDSEMEYFGKESKQIEQVSNKRQREETNSDSDVTDDEESME